MTTDLITVFKSLRLHGMATGYAEVVQNSSSLEVQGSEWLLRHLVRAEQADRGLRSIRYQMHAARFPMHRDLAGFEFEQSKVDRRQIEQFATLEFSERAENIVLIGGTGTGKTHLATALGVQAIGRHGKRVRFYSTIELVNQLEQLPAPDGFRRITHLLVDAGARDITWVDPLPADIIRTPPAIGFTVATMKFQGRVTVLYERGLDLYAVELHRDGELVERVDEVFFDTLGETLERLIDDGSWRRIRVQCLSGRKAVRH